MNQQVAVYDPRQQAPAQTFTMSELERVALAIAKGRLFGSDDPNAVLTLCMVAQAEGKHPGLVMQQYHIIKGKPAKKAEAMLVDFLAAGGTVTWNRLDDECADATFSHPLGGTVTINWTMARAAKAQITGNDTWKKYPRAMLRSRVVSEGVRTVYPGATSGMYVPEEVADFDEGPSPRSATPPTPQAMRARDLKPEPAQIEAQPAPLPDPKRAKAETWLQWLRDEVEGAGGEVDPVRAIFGDAAKTLAKMEKEFPDLHAEAMKLAPDPADQRLVEADPNVNDVTRDIAAADLIIAEINEANAALDVDVILNRNREAIEAMPDEVGASVEIAADKRKTEIKAEQEAAQVAA